MPTEHASLREIALVLLYLPGCNACASAKAPVAELARRIPRLKVERIDVTRPAGSPIPLRFAPTFALRVNGGWVQTWEIENKRDLPDAKKLAAWIAQGLDRALSPPA